MYILIFLGIVIIGIAVLLLIKPEWCFEFAHKYFVSATFQYGVGIAGLILALAIYFSSTETEFPTLFELIALFSLIGGVICVVLPPSDFRSLVLWELKLVSPYGRALGVVYAIIGFLIFAAT